MSTNWKDIGMNSGNMKHHRNVTSNRVNYENGKWDSVYDISGIDSKGYIFDISGQNVVVGIGTDKPFSRLSLGSNENAGEFSPTKPGQLAAIALNEEYNGDKFNGMFYNTDISGQSRGANKISGIQLMSSVNGFDVTDLSNGQLIIGSDNVVTIGGRPRIGNESYNNVIEFLPGTHGGRKIVLDTRGSIRTDGYINFYNKTSTSYEPAGDSYDVHRDIPVGSLFLSAGGGSVTPNAGLYFKKSNNNNASDIVEITGGGGGGGGGGTVDSSGSAFFDGSLNHLVYNANTGNYDNYPFIIQKNKDGNYSGGTPITFSGGVWEKQDASGTKGFQNALTIRQGNLSVVTISGENFKVEDPQTASSLKSAFDDISGGIILAEKQLLLGKIVDDPNLLPPTRSGYAVIDAQTVDQTAILLSYNFEHGTTTCVPYNPKRATNSIILVKKDINEDGNTASISKGCVIGNIFDASNSIIIGGRFGEVSTPNSLISHPLDQGYCNNNIVDPSGCNIVFGYKNTLQYTPNSIIIGAINTVDNTNNKAIDIQTEGGTIVVGSNNVIDNNSTNDPINKKPQNVIFGNNNYSNNSENSFIQGTSNINFGSSNVIFGNSNKLGNVSMTSTLNDYNRYYTTENSFVQGKDNQILAPSGETILNAFIAGKNNTLDMSFNNFSTNTNSGFTLLGCYAGISGENFADPNISNGKIIEDLSNIRFAFGTTEMYNSRVGEDQEMHRGNVFTIDCSGNTHIHGNLIVDGSNVVLRTEYLDVSDNNLSLNYPGTNSPEGGGITILDTTTGQGHKGLIWTANNTYTDNCWDTSGADISTNNIFAMDISAQDISCVDISGQNGFFTGDLSCNGKLYVGGLIDPTGLVLDAQSSIPSDAAGTNKAVIWYDSGETTKLKFNLNNNTTIGSLATEAYVNNQISSGGGSGGAAATKLTIGADTTNVDTRYLLFSGSTGGFQDVSGATGLRCNPSTGKISATIITDGTASLTGGALSGLTTALTIAQGGTGANTAASARTSLGLGSAATSASSDFATSAQGTKADNALPASNVSNFGGTLIDDADANAARTTLGLGSAATSASSDFATSAQGTKADNALPASNVSNFGATLIDDADANAARTTLGLGSAATSASTDFQAAITGFTPSASSIIFDGATSGGVTTTLSITDPQTTNKIITFPDATGTVLLSGGSGSFTTLSGSTSIVAGTDGAANSIKLNPASGGEIIFEGTGNNGSETTLKVTNPTADRTITFPDATGTVLLSGGTANFSFLTLTGNSHTIGDDNVSNGLHTAKIAPPTRSGTATNKNGQSFFIYGQQGANDTNGSSGGKLELRGGNASADNNGNKSGGDITIAGGMSNGSGVQGSILLQGGYGTTGVTIEPDGNIKTNGTLTVDSTSTFTGASTFTGNVTVGGNTTFSIAKPLHTTGAGTPLSINGQQAHDDNPGGIGTQYKGGDVSIVGGAGANFGDQGDINISGKNIKFNNGYGSTGTTISTLGGIQTKGSLTVDSTSTLTGNVSIGGNLTVGGVSLSFTSLTSNTTISSGNYVIGAANLDITLGTPSAAGQIVTIYTTTNSYDLIRNSSSFSVSASTTTVCISTGTGAANWVAYRNGLGTIWI